jgi:2-polyprenyl-6-methoxyphenol hydroxylase-like FAD-dependent oxidoreductase
MAKLKVLIIGAGLGGLTLAQSLRRSQIAVEIFERDDSPWDRPQGYRLHLDADAINAAHEVLTPGLRSVFDATSQHTTPFTTILRPDLTVIKRLLTDDDHGQGIWPPRVGDPVHYNVDRATLRQILLADLEGILHFGKTLSCYEARKDRVIAYFHDGTTAEGDVLVGADGIRSVVRPQRAPHAITVNAGITAIYGRMPIEQANEAVPAETLQDIFTIASDERKVFLGLGSVKFPMSPKQAAAQYAPKVQIKGERDYVVCIVGGRHEYFPKKLHNASSEELQRIAAKLLETWPKRAGSIVAGCDAAKFFLVQMYTSVPCILDLPSRVTLLGHAIHAMTPTLGRGANLAMRDGAMLGRELKKVDTGTVTLSDALGSYERNMLEYGFAVVREAARIGQQRMAQSLLPG